MTEVDNLVVGTEDGRLAAIVSPAENCIPHEYNVLVHTQSTLEVHYIERLKQK